MEINKLDCPRY